MNGRVAPGGRAFTLDKGLAWTIGSALIVLAFWFGVQLSDIRGHLTRTEAAQEDLRAVWDAQAADRQRYRAEVEQRLRTLELARAGNDERLGNALSLLTRIDARLERIEQQYRNMP